MVVIGGIDREFPLQALAMLLGRSFVPLFLSIGAPVCSRVPPRGHATAFPGGRDPLTELLEAKSRFKPAIGEACKWGLG